MFSFSLAQIVTTAIVTFLISGLGGAFLARYLARARPKISVTSVGFHGDVVHLSNAAIDASVNDVWGPSLNGFVGYQVACARENRASKLILELGKVKEIVDEWLAANIIDNSNHVLSKSELQRCPYFSFNHIGSSIYGKLRRRSLSELPVAMDALQQLDRKFDLEENEGRWVLHLGSKGINFPTHTNFSANEKCQQKQIAESFSRGALENIRHIMQSFSTDTANEITKLIKLRDELRRCIAESAHVVLDAVVSNLGDKPTVITSYCSAKLELGDETISMLFRVAGEKWIAEHGEANNPPKKIPGQIKEADVDIGEMFDVEPFLAEASSSPHVSISGGGTEKITLVSTEPMGKTGEKLVKHFELGTLTCALTATTALDKDIHSLRGKFGKELSQQQKQLLLSK